MNSVQNDNLIDMKGLMGLLCVKCRSSVYKYIAENPNFPRPCKLGGWRGRNMFKASEVTGYIHSLKQGA